MSRLIEAVTNFLIPVLAIAAFLAARAAMRVAGTCWPDPKPH